MGRTRTQDFTNFIPSFGNAEQQWGNYTKSPNSHSYNNFIKGESNLNINMKRDKLKDENKITNRK